MGSYQLGLLGLLSAPLQGPGPPSPSAGSHRQAQQTPDVSPHCLWLLFSKASPWAAPQCPTNARVPASPVAFGTLIQPFPPMASPGLLGFFLHIPDAWSLCSCFLKCNRGEQGLLHQEQV